MTILRAEDLQLKWPCRPDGEDIASLRQVDSLTGVTASQDTLGYRAAWSLWALWNLVHPTATTSVPGVSQDLSAKFEKPCLPLVPDIRSFDPTLGVATDRPDPS